MLKILELFAGTRIFSDTAEGYGCKTFTSDWNQTGRIDYVIDFMQFDYNEVPWTPDVIFAAPDCAPWSKAAGSIHFAKKSLKPKTQKAVNAFLLIDKLMQLIKHYQTLNPKLLYYIENPTGKLHKYLQPGYWYSEIPRLVTLDQCQYNREFKKPTHIFTNDMRWVPRKRCPGLPTCHHKQNIKNAGTGSKTSLGKLDGSGYYGRAKLPFQLCEEILLSSLSQFNLNK